MSILVGVGSSQNPNEQEAVNIAYKQAIAPLNGNLPSLLVCFASSTVYNQDILLGTLKSLAGETHIVGCSTAGEITSIGGSLDKSIALMAIYSDQMQFITALSQGIKEDAKKAGQNLAQELRTNSGNEILKAALMLPDGLAGNGADIVRGILDTLGASFMVAGGSAGDDYIFNKTYQYFNDKVYSDSVVGVGMTGNFSFGIGVRHGWIPIGTPRVCTKSKGSIVYELDGKPAIKIYEDHFGKDANLVDKKEPLARLAITYPLGIPAPNKDGYLIRDPITVDDNGAITCAAEVPEGSEVSIMIGSREEAIDAAIDAVNSALQQVQGKTVKAAFLFNCIARKKLLMEKKNEEITKITSILGENIPLIGFYTYGEQAPLGGNVVTCSFHNETDVLFLLAE